MPERLVLPITPLSPWRRPGKACLAVVATIAFAVIHPASALAEVLLPLLLVANKHDGTVTLVNANTLEPMATATTGMLVEPNGQRAFVANSGDATVAVISMETFRVLTRIPIGQGPDGLGFALSPH